MDNQIPRNTRIDKVFPLMTRMNHSCDERTQVQRFFKYPAAHCNLETLKWICVF